MYIYVHIYIIDICIIKVNVQQLIPKSFYLLLSAVKLLNIWINLYIIALQWDLRIVSSTKIFQNHLQYSFDNTLIGINEILMHTLKHVASISFTSRYRALTYLISSQFQNEMKISTKNIATKRISSPSNLEVSS